MQLALHWTDGISWIGLLIMVALAAFALAVAKSGWLR
jgi:hypothetical protein